MNKNEETKITVVIPCYNEEQTVAAVLTTVLKQNVVGEVIVMARLQITRIPMLSQSQQGVIILVH